MPNPLWFIFWLLVFWFVSFFVAFFCAFFYIWVYAFASCIPALTVSGYVIWVLRGEVYNGVESITLPASSMRHLPYRPVQIFSPLVISGTYHTWAYGQHLYLEPISDPLPKNIQLTNSFCYHLQGISEILLQGVQFPFYCGKAMLEGKAAF